jgi:copper chaperone NosL
MDARTTASTPLGEASGDGSPPRPGRLDLAVRIGVGVVAAVLIALAFWAPIWGSSLDAPQYPGGLELIAYGGRVEGDVREISALNHYVGMRGFDVADFPEMKLWGPTILACLAAVVVSTIYGKRLVGRLARLFVWSVPFGILALIQLRLYQYGHDLTTDPRPALTIEPFTPKVVGPTKVLNFTNWAMPGLAIFFLLGAAALLSFGPGLRHTVGQVAHWLDQPMGGEETTADEPAVAQPAEDEPTERPEP